MLKISWKARTCQVSGKQHPSVLALRETTKSHSNHSVKFSSFVSHFLITEVRRSPESSFSPSAIRLWCSFKTCTGIRSAVKVSSMRSTPAAVNLPSDEGLRYCSEWSSIFSAQRQCMETILKRDQSESGWAIFGFAICIAWIQATDFRQSLPVQSDS